MSTLLNPREIRRTATIEVDLGDGTFVRAKKADMTLLMLEGRIPMPLLVAVQKMIAMPSATPEERIAALGSENTESFIELLRRHAVAVVVEPKLSLAETGDEDVLPVTFLQLPQLMTIWGETALVPSMGREEAATFRGDSSSVDVDDAPPREGVRPSTEFVAPPVEGELVSR